MIDRENALKALIKLRNRALGNELKEYVDEWFSIVREAIEAKEPEYVVSPDVTGTIASLRQEVERLNGLYGIIDGQKVIISELEAEIKILRSKANDSER